ncbi:uncharacterized protein LOC117319298 [Pecten maximus]|uniref:uncharacterized protein LOC117319298 n=1 Tax=Pecten maximus TaxID=6579 RepID=UPI0014583088|nr:uncharacterized protein LOC117319298 [Pecten maximus]
MECAKHPGNQIVSVCVTCDTTLVCVECMTDVLHQGHVFRKPQRIANDIKTKLKQNEAGNRNLMSCLETDLIEIQKRRAQQDDEQKERVKLINEQREEVTRAVNKMADNLISHYETQTQCNCVKLKHANDEISAKLEKVRRHEEDVNRIIDESDEIKVVNDSQKLEDIDGHRNLVPKLDTIEFTPRKVNTSQLTLMFEGNAAEMDEGKSLQAAQSPSSMAQSTYKGSDFVGTLVHKGRELVLKTTFKHTRYRSIQNMCSGCSGKAWIRCEKGREITLIDQHGHIERTLTFSSNIAGMTTVNGDTLLVCGKEERDIKQVTLPTGKVTSVFSTGKLYPRDICTAQNGDLFVTLMDEFGFNVTADSERVLVQYSSQGLEKGRASHDRRGDALFVRPYRVRTSNTGDVIGVTNCTDNYNKHLVLLNGDLTLRLRFLGHGKVISVEEKFDTTTYKPDTMYFIYDFIFDSFDNVVICEKYSACVQLLSRDCVPMATILPTQKIIPRSVTMADEEMWLGFNDGTVNVYEVYYVYFIFSIYLSYIQRHLLYF